ncbi:MAG: hypothetical protein ACT4PT_09105 [Methanobacteriota archaeon]
MGISLWDLPAIWALASGLFLVATGLRLLAGRAGSVPRTAFGSFLALWGGMVLAGNLGRLAVLHGDLEGGRRWLLVQQALLLSLYVPLAYFVATFPARRGPAASGTFPAIALLLPGVLGALAFVAEPSLFHGGFSGTYPRIESRWGPLSLVFSGLFTVGLFAAVVRSSRSPGPGSSVAAGISTFVAYWSGETFFFLVAARFQAAPSFGPIADATYFLLSAAGLALVFHRLTRSPSRWVSLALFCGAVAGIAGATPGLPPLETLGMWRILAFGIAARALVSTEASAEPRPANVQIRPSMDADGSAFVRAASCTRTIPDKTS